MARRSSSSSSRSSSRSKRQGQQNAASTVMQTMDNQTVTIPPDLSHDASQAFISSAQALAQRLGVPLDTAADNLYQVMLSMPKGQPRVIAIRDAYDKIVTLSQQLHGAVAAGPGAMASASASVGAGAGGVYVKNGAGWQNVMMNVSAQANGLRLAAQSTLGTVPSPSLPSLQRRQPASASPTFGVVTCPHCRMQVSVDEYITIGDRATFTGCRTCVNQYAARMRDLVGMSAAFANFAHFAREVSHWYRGLDLLGRRALSGELRAQIESIGNVIHAAERMQLQEKFATTTFPESAIEQHYNLVGVTVNTKRQQSGLDHVVFVYTPSERARALALYLLDAHEGLFPLLREIAESLSAFYAQRQLPPPILTLAYCDRRATLYDHEPFLLLDVQAWSDDERDLLATWTVDEWLPRFEARIVSLNDARRLVLAWQFIRQVVPARLTSSTLWEEMDDASSAV